MKGRLVGRTVLPFVCLWLVWSVGAVSMANAEGMRRGSLTIISGGKSHKFEVEFAETGTQQALGLMYRTQLGRRQGMLFPYLKPAIRTMWMKNTYISLDMVFIGADGRILRIAEHTEPQSEEVISSGVPAQGVLELVAGVAEELKLKPGDRVVEKKYFPAKAD